MSFRLIRAILVASSLVPANVGPAGAEQLLLNVKAQAAAPAPEAAPAGLNLGGGFIEFLLTGHITPAPPGEAAPVQPAAVSASRATAVPVPGPAAADPQDGNVIVVDYTGPFEPGSVILNVTKKQVYRILPGGRMAIYENDESQIKLARAILKQTAR